MSHVESLMRHCAIVSPQPHVHVSEFIRFNATSFCSFVRLFMSTSGSSVASVAFFRKIWPVSSKVSTFAFTGSASNERTSASYSAGSCRTTICF